MATTTAPLRDQTRLLAMSLAHFLNDGYVNYLPGVLPVLLSNLHIPLALVGSLVLVLQLTSFLQPLSGILADRFGGKAFALGGLALNAIAAALVGIAPNYGTLLLLLLLASLGSTLFHPQALAGARTLSQRAHGTGMSIFLVGGELGRGVWPVLAGLLVVALGLKGLLLLAIPGLLAVVGLARFLPSLPPQPSAGSPLRHVWRSSVLLLILYVGIRSLIAAGVSTFVPLIWHQAGGSLVGGASLVSVMLVIGILGNLAGGWLSDRWGRRPVLVASGVLSALSLIAYLEATGIALWLSLAVLGIAVFCTAPVTMLIGQDLFPENRSLGSGIALGVGSALGAVGVLLLGLIAAWLGLLAPVRLLIVMALISTPLAWWLTASSGAPSQLSR
jgi:FSR family fosmidomycin resistance protein-like MFS transporter